MTKVAEHATTIAKAAMQQANHFEMLRQRYGDHQEAGNHYNAMPPAAPGAMNYPAMGQPQNSSPKMSMPNAKSFGYETNYAGSYQNSLNGQNIPSMSEYVVNTFSNAKPAPLPSVPTSRGFMGYFQNGIAKAQNYFGQQISNAQNQIKSIRPIANNVQYQTGFGTSTPLKSNLNTASITAKPVLKIDTNVPNAIMKHVSSAQNSNGENGSIAGIYQSKLHGVSTPQYGQGNGSIAGKIAESNAEYNIESDDLHSTADSKEKKTGCVESNSAASEKISTDDYEQTAENTTPELVPEMDNAAQNMDSNALEQAQQQTENIAADYVKIPPEDTAEERVDQPIENHTENMPEDQTKQATESTAGEHDNQLIENKTENMHEDRTDQPTENTAEDHDGQNVKNDVKIAAEEHAAVINSGNGTSINSVTAGSSVTAEIKSNTTVDGSNESQSSSVTKEPESSAQNSTENVNSTAENQFESSKSEYETAQNTTAKSCELVRENFVV